MPGVFISYRREDSAGYTGRLFDILSAEFGKTNTYMDLDTIVGGDDFTAVIEDKVSVSDVLVAVIGNRWLTITEENGSRRLDNPRDFVRIEIEKALERGIRVIPVLVAGASMPREDDLPAVLKALCERQAVEIRDSHFHPDAQQLIDVLHTALHHGRLRPLNVSLKRFAPALLSGAAVVVILSGILLFQQRKPAIRSDSNPARKEQSESNSGQVPQAQPHQRVEADGTKNFVKTPVNVAGKWTATVKYDWGDTYSELFDFEVNGQEVSGMAGFLGNDGHTILNGRIAGNRINFMTKTLTTLGNGEQTSEDKHYYQGEIEGDSIRFSMVTDSSVQSHAPVHFTANKVEKK